MSDISNQWYSFTRAMRSWTSSLFGYEAKDYRNMITELAYPDPHDQSILLRVQAAYIYYSVASAAASGLVSFYACTKAGGPAYRWRGFTTMGCMWFGGFVGLKYGERVAASWISTLQDTQLKDIMRAYNANWLSPEESKMLRLNILDRLDVAGVQAYEAEKRDLSLRDKLEHLKSEKERAMKAIGINTPSTDNPSTPEVPPAEIPAHTAPKLSGPTPYLHKRLPEAIEAERKRNEAKSDQPPSRPEL